MLAPKRAIVGHELLGAEARFDNWVACPLEHQRPIGDQLRANVAALRGELGPGGDDVELRDSASRGEQPSAAGTDLRQQLVEQFLFQLLYACLGAEDARLHVLERTGDEPLAV